jgi:hypothetical protein
MNVANARFNVGYRTTVTGSSGATVQERNTNIGASVLEVLIIASEPRNVITSLRNQATDESPSLDDLYKACDVIMTGIADRLDLRKAS